MNKLTTALFFLGVLAVNVKVAADDVLNPETVDLGSASHFAILAGSQVTDAGGVSVVTGDVGLAPASGSFIGLTAAQVAGTIYSVNAAGPSGSISDLGL